MKKQDVIRILNWNANPEKVKDYLTVGFGYKIEHEYPVQTYTYNFNHKHNVIRKENFYLIRKDKANGLSIGENIASNLLYLHKTNK